MVSRGTGFSFEEGARLVCGAVREYDPETLSDARVIAYSDAEYEQLERAAEEVRND
jgi:O-acetyl-ADP-ribose deacetylase (regulator of RNase III)